MELSVLVVEPGKIPYRSSVSDVESMQQIVGGMTNLGYLFSDPVVLVCNNKGIEEQLPFNRMADECPIYGTFFIIGDGAEDFESLPEPLMEKYSQKFLHPEISSIQNGEVVSYKVTPEIYQAVNSLIIDFDI